MPTIPSSRKPPHWIAEHTTWLNICQYQRYCAKNAKKCFFISHFHIRESQRILITRRHRMLTRRAWSDFLRNSPLIQSFVHSQKVGLIFVIIIDNYHPHHRHHHRRHRSIDHHTNLEDLLKMKNVYIQAFPTRLWTCESTRAPRTERFSSRGFRSRWISPLQDRRCLWCLIKISSAACHLQWLHPHQHYGHLDHRWRQHQSLATRCSLTGKGSPTSTRHQVITIVTI